MSTTFIYALCDPQTFDVRYVGKADNPYKRYYQHLIDKDKHSIHKINWIQSLLKKGLLPIQQILEECDESIWEERERDWIAFYKKIGAPLTNGTDGGKGNQGIIYSNVTRKKLSEVAKKRNFGGWPKGKKHSEEWRLKHIGHLSYTKGMVPWNKGKCASEESKRKNSESHKGKIPWNKDKHHSKETKEKISIARKGKKLGPLGAIKAWETRRKHLTIGGRKCLLQH